MSKWLMVFGMMLMLWSSEMPAQEQREARKTPSQPHLADTRKAPKVLGYVDLDRDGVNDRFRDANGDGVNDITKVGYLHRFEFVDRNEDGVNDRFVDADGDGVNDLDARYVDRDKDGICDNVIDYDGDGINDITGLKYSKASLKGFRYGRVDEERKKVHRRFVDADGDGMHDLRGARGMRGRGGVDHFVDEDGDGICDGRTIRGRGMGPPVWARRGHGTGDARGNAGRRGATDTEDKHAGGGQ